MYINKVKYCTHGKSGIDNKNTFITSRYFPMSIRTVPSIFNNGVMFITMLQVKNFEFCIICKTLK